MLTHEILKRSVYSPPAMPYHNHRPRVPQQQMGGPWPTHPYTPSGVNRYMEKLEYAKFVESEEVRKFRPGEYVTIASAPIVLNRAPSMAWLVDHIQEIHYMAPMDDQGGQPRCVFVKPTMSAPAIGFAPQKLRKLTTEEAALVYLRNQKTPAYLVETKPELETTVIGGEAVIIDKGTGQIVQREDEGVEPPDRAG